MPTFRVVALSETARRIRAAMAYGGFKGRDALAEAIELSPSTLQRIEGVAEPTRPPKRSELWAIADACKVPMWFLESGWQGASGEPPGDVDEIAKRALSDLKKDDDSPATERGRRAGGEG